MTEVNAVAEQTGAGCCGGPAPKDNACCAQDAAAKAAGETDCGCTAAPPQKGAPAAATSCCG